MQVPPVAHIMVAEANPRGRVLFRQTLEQAGHTVRSVATGTLVLHALEVGPLPDLIILDVDLLPPTAFEVLTAIHAAGHQIPILLIGPVEDTAALQRHFSGVNILPQQEFENDFLACIQQTLR